MQANPVRSTPNHRNMYTDLSKIGDCVFHMLITSPFIIHHDLTWFHNTYWQRNYLISTHQTRVVGQSNYSAWMYVCGVGVWVKCDNLAERRKWRENCDAFNSREQRNWRISETNIYFGFRDDAALFRIGSPLFCMPLEQMRDWSYQTLNSGLTIDFDWMIVTIFWLQN